MPQYPPNCGERFAHLIPGPCQGLGLGFGLCGLNDVRRALATAKALHEALLNTWNDLIAIENEQGSYPVTDAWRAEHDAWDARFHALPDDWWSRTWDPWLFHEGEVYQRLIDVSRDGACLLDGMLADAESRGYGAVTVPVEPYGPPEPDGIFDSLNDSLTEAGRTVVTLAVIAVVGFLGYQIWDRYG